MNWLFQVIELNSLGRLLSYNPETGNVKLLLDSLYMPNGIALSPDEHFLLLAETSIGRILKYTHTHTNTHTVCQWRTGVHSTLSTLSRFWLKGPKAGTKEVVMDNMVGYPDNIRLSDHGTFLVGITTTRFRKLTPPFLDMIAPYPAVKRFLAKVSVADVSDIILLTGFIFSVFSFILTQCKSVCSIPQILAQAVFISGYNQI